MPEIISKQHLSPGKSFICIYDTDQNVNHTWHTRRLVFKEFHHDLLLFSADDGDEGLLTLDGASGITAYNKSNWLCLVSEDSLSEEDMFLYKLTGNFEHLIEELGIDHEQITNDRRH